MPQMYPADYDGILIISFCFLIFFKKGIPFFTVFWYNKRVRTALPMR